MQDNLKVYFRTWGNDNISYGPVELPGLVDWVRKGRVMRNTWVFSERKGEWSRAADLPELKMFFKSKAAPGAQTSPATQGIKPESLRRIKILAEMEDQQLASLLEYMEVLNLAPNAVVFRKGEHGDSMILVLQGELRAGTMVGGRESMLSVMGVGECVGELAIIDESPRSADVVANVESVVLKISAEALRKLFKEAPALAAPLLLGLSKTITSRVRKLTKRYEDSILFARTAGAVRQ